MKRRMWAPVLSLGILGLGVLLASCGPKPQTRTGLFLDINQNSLEQVDKDGLRISVKAITLENCSSFPAIFTKLAAQAPPGPTTTPWVDVNVPAFELSLLNNTGHVLRFTRAVIKLQDDHGTIYEPSTKADLEAMVDAHARKLAEGQVTIDIAAARGRIKALKMADQDLELLPGITEKVYSTFNYPEEPATFLAKRSSLKLMLYEIPVATDDAGEVTKTANFEFMYDIHARTVGATR